MSQFCFVRPEARLEEIFFRPARLVAVRYGLSRLAGTLLLIAGVLLTGCQTRSPVFSDLGDFDPRTGTYANHTVQEGDVLSIAFQFTTNFNTTQKIPLDGLLNLESVGQVKVVGKTPIQVQTELAELYRPQVKDEVITVRVVASAASIYVSGAVLRPGKIPLDRPMTLLEAIEEAGGIQPGVAKMSEVRVLRAENGRQVRYTVDLKRIIQGRDGALFYLKPFDIVQVPAKAFNF
ncbi:MAG: polysaccharide biosynthesis/export family protein [Akkermansiaceae bacterium]|nr:polysaccharide biosynthesis/export family protein [Verrucomicrobiales bacterium]